MGRPAVVLQTVAPVAGCGINPEKPGTLDGMDGPLCGFQKHTVLLRSGVTAFTFRSRSHQQWSNSLRAALSSATPPCGPRL